MLKTLRQVQLRIFQWEGSFLTLPAYLEWKTSRSEFPLFYTRVIKKLRIQHAQEYLQDLESRRHKWVETLCLVCVDKNDTTDQDEDLSWTNVFYSSGTGLC